MITMPTTSPDRVQDAPTAVYLLADHLDAALAAGEDLAAEQFAVAIPAGVMGVEAIAAAVDDRRRYIERVRGLELTLIARVLEARKRADELKRIDIRFKRIAMAFESGTVALVDAVADLGDMSVKDFHDAGCTLAFLRERTMIPDDAASLSGIETLAVTDTFRIAGRIELAPLLDLVATFLDTLELHYEVFAAAEAHSAEGRAAEAPTAAATRG
jgi:hypothetical protein